MVIAKAEGQVLGEVDVGSQRRGLEKSVAVEAGRSDVEKEWTEGNSCGMHQACCIQLLWGDDGLRGCQSSPCIQTCSDR